MSLSLGVEVEVPTIEVEIEAEFEVEVEAPNVEFEVEAEMPVVEVELELACDVEAPIVDIELEAGGSGRGYSKSGPASKNCHVIVWSVVLAVLIVGNIISVILYGKFWWVWVSHGVLVLLAAVFLVLSIMRCKGGANANDGGVMVEVDVEAGGGYGGNMDYEVEIAGPVFEVPQVEFEVEVAAPVFEGEVDAGVELEVEAEVEVEVEVEVENGVSL
jgi:hypothetical protein